MEMVCDSRLPWDDAVRSLRTVSSMALPFNLGQEKLTARLLALAGVFEIGVAHLTHGQCLLVWMNGGLIQQRSGSLFRIDRSFPKRNSRRADLPGSELRLNSTIVVECDAYHSWHESQL